MKPQRPRYLLTRQMDAFASRAASNTLPKLIDGASGTGKTILASVIHKRSPRSSGPFVTQGCGDFHESLAGSRFLGHEKGAFTGAHERVPGIFEQANRGTLALNDLDALSMELQTNLLHIFDHGQVTRLGGKSPIDVDVQVIVTTNQDPEGLVAAGRLRGDVFSRVSHIRFTCPPLSERDDVPELAQVMLLNLWQRGFAHRTDPCPVLTPGALEAIRNHHFWPLNCRSLESLLGGCLVAARNGAIKADLMESQIAAQLERWTKLGRRVGRIRRRPKYERVGTEEDERDLMERALEKTGGNVTRAARLCGMGRSTFSGKMKIHGLGR